MWRLFKKTAIHKPGSVLLRDSKSAGILDLDFLASRIVRNKFPLYKLPNYGILLSQPQTDEEMIIENNKLKLFIRIKTFIRC